MLSLCSLINNYRKSKLEVIDWQAWSSQDPALHPRSMLPGFGDVGWVKGVFEPLQFQGWVAARSKFEDFKTFGADRIAVWLPFGHRDTGDFDFFALQDCKADPRMKLVADVADFVECWSRVYSLLKKPFVFYLGYIGAVPEYVDKYPGASIIPLIEDELRPYRYLKEKTGANIRIVIDTMAIRHADSVNWTTLAPLIKSYGLELGGEAWPDLLCPGASDPSYQNWMAAYQVNRFDPAKYADAIPWAMPKTKIKGPLIPISIGEGFNTLEESRVSALRYLKDYGVVAYPGWDPGITADQLKERALKLPYGK